MSNSRLALITFVDGGQPVDPGYGQGGGGNYPSTGPIYGGGHPGHGLPPPGHIATLPVYPFDPTRPDAGLPEGGDKPLPGGGSGRPDNSLPQFRPGMKFVMKWLACSGLILVPDNELPETPEPK